MFKINEEIKKSNVERDSCKMKANKNNSAWAPYDMRDRKPPIYNRYPSEAFIVNERIWVAFVTSVTRLLLP